MWVLIAFVVWLVVALAIGLVIGQGIRLADRRERRLEPDVFPAGRVAAPRTAVPDPVRRRRSIPLPPVGIALAALSVLLEGAGFVLRQTGATGPLAAVFSMDAPHSLPRMYVTALFAASALVGLAGAGVVTGRRSWWTAVGLIAAGIASVKAGGTWHAWALDRLSEGVGALGGFLISIGLALAVVGTLWFLSRDERRDRRRVLGSLAGYAVAAVGLSALSQIAPADWTAAATFVEESGEALAGVAFLVAVLAGVAPGMVLPAGWPLRRAADAQNEPRSVTVRGNVAR
jgi:uncharacterized membrane protein YidH (DUF202 family)